MAEGQNEKFQLEKISLDEFQILMNFLLEKYDQARMQTQADLATDQIEAAHVKLQAVYNQILNSIRFAYSLNSNEWTEFENYLHSLDPDRIFIDLASLLPSQKEKTEGIEDAEVDESEEITLIQEQIIFQCITLLFEAERENVRKTLNTFAQTHKGRKGVYRADLPRTKRTALFLINQVFSSIEGEAKEPLVILSRKLEFLTEFGNSEINPAYDKGALLREGNINQGLRKSIIARLLTEAGEKQAQGGIFADAPYKDAFKELFGLVVSNDTDSKYAEIPEDHYEVFDGKTQRRINRKEQYMVDQLSMIDIEEATEKMDLFTLSQKLGTLYSLYQYDRNTQKSLGTVGLLTHSNDLMTRKIKRKIRDRLDNEIGKEIDNSYKTLLSFIITQNQWNAFNQPSIQSESSRVRELLNSITL